MYAVDAPPDVPIYLLFLLNFPLQLPKPLHPDILNVAVIELYIASSYFIAPKTVSLIRMIFSTHYLRPSVLIPSALRLKQ